MAAGYRGQKKIGTRGYHSVKSHANFKQPKELFDVFVYRMNSNSLYLGSGHNASSTISSSLSIS